MNTREYSQAVVRELGDTLNKISPESGERLIDGILGAKKIFVAGAGRSGFAARSFAMRLMHLGLETYVVGETITPHMDSEDLLILVTGSGETESLVAMARKADRAGAKVAAVTIRPESSVGQVCDVIVCIPAPTPKAEDADKAHSIQPMGSLFEQSCLLFLDSVILRLMERENITSEQMFARHANLE